MAVPAERVCDVMNRHFDLTGRDDTPQEPEELERLTTQMASATNLDPEVVRRILEQLDTELRATGLLTDMPSEPAWG